MCVSAGITNVERKIKLSFAHPRMVATSRPFFSKRWTDSGNISPLFIIALSLSTIDFGVPAGATMPYQPVL